jgi:hypothetical protein
MKRGPVCLGSVSVPSTSAELGCGTYDEYAGPTSKHLREHEYNSGGKMKCEEKGWEQSTRSAPPF